jgi:hypothetical protein
MNEKRTGASDQVKLLNITETVTKLPPYLFIMKPGRRLLCKSTLWKLGEDLASRGRRFTAFIMTDMILLAVQSKGGFLSSSKLVFEETIPITQIRFSESDSAKYSDRSLTMKSDIHEYTFVFAEAPRMTEFITKVKKQKKDISKKVKHQSTEGAAHIQDTLNTLSAIYLSPQPHKTKTELLQLL